MGETKRAWLFRGARGEVMSSADWYRLALEEPRTAVLDDCGDWEFDVSSLRLCAEEWESFTGIKLPPGGGPLQIQMTFEVVT